MSYYYMVATLDHTTVGWLVDILSSSPVDDSYATLHTCPTATFDLGCSKHTLHLLNMGSLGDHCLSELINLMLTLFYGHTFCLLAKQLFLDQLTNNNFTDHQAVALQANSLCQACSPGIPVNQVEWPPPKG